MPHKLALTLLFGLALAVPACASPLAFHVDNMLIEAHMDAGQSQTGVITVSNLEPASAAGATTDSIRIRVYPVDWTLDRKGDPQFLPAGAQPDSCSSWLQISPIEVEVAPGQSQTVRYTINVPAGIQGTYRCMVMFETVPQPGAKGQHVMLISGRIGAAVYVMVGPQAKRLKIDSFGVTPSDTELAVENTGNTYVRTKGRIQFQDSAGNIVQQVSLPAAVVLSGQNNEREFDISTPKLPSGAYTATAVIDYGGTVLIGARTHVTVP